MTKTIGVFDCKVNSPKEGGVAFNANVTIGPVTYSSDKNGRISLTPHLMTEGEIDWYVDALKKDLDYVSRKAKKALKTANEKTRQMVTMRIGERDG